MTLGLGSERRDMVLFHNGDVGPFVFEGTPVLARSVLYSKGALLLVVITHDYSPSIINQLSVVHAAEFPVPLE